jgi:hypothetical protein
MPCPINYNIFMFPTYTTLWVPTSAGQLVWQCGRLSDFMHCSHASKMHTCFCSQSFCLWKTQSYFHPSYRNEFKKDPLFYMLWISYLFDFLSYICIYLYENIFTTKIIFNFIMLNSFKGIPSLVLMFYCFYWAQMSLSNIVTCIWVIKM